jgi:hypothetical protein
MSGRFQGSCFVVHGFRPIEMSARLTPKHDMFLCRFTPRPILPMCGNLCWATSKRVIHLRLVAEITLGVILMLFQNLII